MTHPSDGFTPEGGVGPGGLSGFPALQGKSEQDWRDEINGAMLSSINPIGVFRTFVTSFFGGFSTVLDAIFGTVDDAYIAALPIINDHSQSITDIEEALEVLVLQGLAIKYTSNGTYTPSAGITSVEVIVIGAGAGGAAGRWDVIAADRRNGGGGGGGGEVHAMIPASTLPMTGGVFDPITITIGAAGAGGTTDAGPGVGGGNTSFGGLITAGGGVGGTAAIGGVGGGGGAGMIPGGNGGNGNTGSVAATSGGNSTSAYSLNGGGGGGGGGAIATGVGNAMPGGIGGISAGGAVNGNGDAPSAVVATGGGGGGGGAVGSNAGHGAFPAGGGGGGSGGITAPKGNGGNGGNGVLYVIERAAELLV